MTKMITHRGVSQLAPENTLPAYELGGKYGYFGFECDVQETMDHEFILMHDETVDRMTNGTGKVSDYTLEELKQCSIQNGANFESFPSLKVPRLKDYLQVCKRYSVTPVIEIKKISNSSLNKLLTLINQWFMSQQVIMISFHKETLTAVREQNTQMHLQWITKLNKKNIKYCSDHRMNINSKHKYVTEELVRLAHEVNVLVNVWTVNDGILLRALIAMGVDFITTDFLMHHQLVDSQATKHYTFRDKTNYKSYLNDKLIETLNLKLKAGSWRWNQTIDGIEIRNQSKTLTLLSVPLSKLKEGDRISFSFWFFQLAQSNLGIFLKSEQQDIIQMKTGLNEGWEFVEFQSMVIGIRASEAFNLEFRSLIENGTHCLIKQLKIKIDYM